MSYFTSKCAVCQGSGREYIDKDIPCFSCNGTGRITLSPKNRRIYNPLWFNLELIRLRKWSKNG